MGVVQARVGGRIIREIVEMDLGAHKKVDRRPRCRIMYPVGALPDLFLLTSPSHHLYCLLASLVPTWKGQAGSQKGGKHLTSIHYFMKSSISFAKESRRGMKD